MPFRANVTTAAAAGTSRRSILLGANTRKDTYVDDPEEEARLLESGEYRDGEDTGREEEPGSPYSVCFRFVATREL